MSHEIQSYRELKIIISAHLMLVFLCCLPSALCAEERQVIADSFQNAGGVCSDASETAGFRLLLNNLDELLNVGQVVSTNELKADIYLKSAIFNYRNFISSSSRCLKSGVVSLDELIILAANTYPSVLSRRFELASAGQEVESAKWQFWPSLSISNDTYNGGVSRVEVKQPIWTGGQLTAGVHQAEAQRDTSRWQVAESRLNTAERVIDTYSDWLNNYKKKID